MCGGEEACPEGRCRAVRSSFVSDGDFLLLLAESYPPEAKRKSHWPETKYDTFAKRPCNDRRMSRRHDRSFPLIPAAGSGIFRKVSKLRSLPVFIVQRRFRSRKGSASAYTLPDRSYPARAVISRLLPFREKEVRFPYFCRNNNNSIKTVRFHFPPERMWKESCAIICMYQRMISLHTYRFFHGGTRLWKFYRQKT